MKLLIITLGILAAAGGLGWRYIGNSEEAESTISPGALFSVRRGDLEIGVTENGYLKAKNSEEISPEFRGHGTITWLVEEGELVKEGDLMVEFDKTDVETKINEQENRLIQYESELEAAVAELEIQKRDNVASVEKAELKLDLAKLVLERFREGESPNELRKLKLAREKAESAHERAREQFEQVPALESEGFMTKIQVEEERIKLREAEINEENADRELELYETYSYKMDLTQKQSDVKDAQRELDNAKIKSGINLKQKEANLTQRKRHVERTKAQLAEEKKELEAMTIVAPIPGIIHYGDPARYWTRDNVKVGNSVHQGNTIITLPDLREMQVLIDVHEADIDLVDKEMDVVVTIETHKGMVFPGKVTEIATVASSENWTDESNKTFRVEIDMEPVEIELRAGVTAKAEIRVEVLKDVVHVPIHSVISESGEYFSFVHVNGVGEKRIVEVGKNNSHFVEVVSGLEEGEEVLLYDPRTEGVDTGFGSEKEASESEDDDSGMPGSGLAAMVGGNS